MGLITIYRFTDVNDTISTAEKLVFNDETDLKTKNVHGFITDVVVDPIEGIGDNQAAEQNYGDLQALGSVEKEYTLTGFISARSTNPNSFLDTLKDWQDDAKTSKGVFEQGRFGFTDEDDPTDDVIPIPNTQPNPSGLIWQSLQKTSNMQGNRTNFILKFKFSVGDST